MTAQADQPQLDGQRTDEQRTDGQRTDEQRPDSQPRQEQQPDDGGVRVEVAGPVATITLDRPETLNAQTPYTWQALARAGVELAADVRVVVVRGAGRAFSAGLSRAMFTGDVPGAPGLPQLAAMHPSDTDELVSGWQQGFDWLRRPDIVSVAAVQGHAIGAGFQLALACDIRVLAEDAQLCMAETSLGLVPDLTGSKALVDLVGVSRAMEICLTGRRIGAAEAERIGLASLVVPTEGLAAAVDDLVAALLAPPRAAVTETKALLVAAGGRTHPEQQAAERAAQGRRLRALGTEPAAATSPAATSPAASDPSARTDHPAHTDRKD